MVLIREFIDICHDVGYEKATNTLIPILRRLIRDSDDDVRRGALSIMGDLVGFLVQSDLDEGYRVVLSSIIPIIKEVLLGDRQHTSISVKEVACRVGITLCSHLRHSDRVHSILSIGLALANELDDEDSRCLASWMLNGLAEYMGRDICVQFIIPQIKCLADDPCEKVRMFATMNLCEVIRITQSCVELLPVFKRLILHDSKPVRRCAVKVIIGIFSSMKTIDSSSFSAFLVEIFREVSDEDLTNDLNKQIGPLITLFKDPDSVPREILDAYLAMGMSSDAEVETETEVVGAEDSEAPDSGGGGTSSTGEVSSLNQGDGKNSRRAQREQSESSSRKLSVPEERPKEASDKISLLPFGSHLGLTFRELELNGPSYFCSYSFASVFSHLGPGCWPEFSGLLVRLVESPYRSVRLPIAASMSLILATALSCGDRSHSRLAGSASCFPAPWLSEAPSGTCGEGVGDKDSKGERSSAEIKKEQDEFSNTIERGVDLFYNNIHQDPARYLLTGSPFKLPCSKGCLPRFDQLPLLLDLVGKLLDDNDIFVKRAIFGCLSDIVKCLPRKEHVEAIIKKFPDLLNSCRTDWRCRNILARQVRKICIELHLRNMQVRKQSEAYQELFTGRFAQEYLSPMAFSLLLDPVSEVRKTAISSVSSLLRISSPFLWHFFQNGGNVHDLPSPIRPPDSLPKDFHVQAASSLTSASSSSATLALASEASASSSIASTASSPFPSPTPINTLNSAKLTRDDNGGGDGVTTVATVTAEYDKSKGQKKVNKEVDQDGGDASSTSASMSGKLSNEMHDSLSRTGSTQPPSLHKQGQSKAFSSVYSFSSSSDTLYKSSGGIGCPGIIVGGVGSFSSISNSKITAGGGGGCGGDVAASLIYHELSFPENLRVLFSLDEESGNCKLLNELALIWCILKTFAMSVKYHHRQEFIQMSDRFIRDIPRGFFYAYFLNPLILLASDPVRNVRSTWLRVIGPHIKDSGRLAQCANIVAACKLMSLSELDKECNRYLSNIKFLPKSTLKRVDFMSVKDITGIIGQTAKYDDILSWNQQPLIKHFNLYMEEVLGSLWCLDNVPGSSLLAFSNTSCASRRPFHSSERSSDLSIEYEMMLLEVRPNSSPTNISSLAPVITSDTTSTLEFGPSYNDLISSNTNCDSNDNHNALFSCRLGISRRPSELLGSNTDPSCPSAALDGVSSGVMECDSAIPNSLTSFSDSSLEILFRPGIPRNYSKFICPSGAETSFRNTTEPEPAEPEPKPKPPLAAQQTCKAPIRKTHKSHVQKLKQDPKTSLVFDHKLHEATRNFFMVDIARAATDDLF